MQAQGCTLFLFSANSQALVPVLLLLDDSHDRTYKHEQDSDDVQEHAEAVANAGALNQVMELTGEGCDDPDDERESRKIELRIRKLLKLVSNTVDCRDKRSELDQDAANCDCEEQEGHVRLLPL